jgi:hypothetical protein
MPTSTIPAPATHAALEAEVGFSYVFSGEDMLLELQDRMDPLKLGIVSLRGDLAGSGSDVLRITEYGNVGWSVAMSALASEVATVAASTTIAGYETITVGTYGISHSETYSAQAFARPEAAGLSLDALKQQVPNSYLKTVRGLIATAGAGITAGTVGSASTTLGVDDWLDLGTAYRTNPGASMPTAILHSTPFDQLARSFRNEPGFQNSAQEFAAVMGVAADEQGRVMQMFPNYLGLGVNVAYTNDVTTSGGAYQSFSTSAGGIGLATASTSPIVTAGGPDRTIYIPEFGLLIEEMTEGGATNTRIYKALAFVGVAVGSDNVYVNRRILSTT